MTRNADLRLIGVDAAATGETLKGGFAPAMGAARIKAIFAGDGRGRPLARASIAELAVTFLLGLAAVPFLALHLIGASLVRAFGGIVAALAPERIVRDGVLLAIVAAVFWDKPYRLDATLAMGATLVSSIVMFGLVRI